ncbi:hypothetical protein MMC10_008057 [Thelotrema lepadinum]|nr:hypothetical protein [Thelotrema lepadinum]
MDIKRYPVNPGPEKPPSPRKPPTRMKPLSKSTNRLLDISRLAEEAKDPNLRKRSKLPVLRDESGWPVKTTQTQDRESFKKLKWHGVDVKVRNDIALFGRRGFGEYAISLEINEELAAGINAIRREFHRPRDSPSDAQAWIFIDLQEKHMQKIKEELVRSARKTRIFPIRANELAIEGSHVRLQLSMGKNDLGNMIGRLRFRLGYHKSSETAKFLKQADALFMGAYVHWPMLGFHRFDIEDRKGVANTVRQFFEDLKYRPDGKAVGLKLWRRSTVENQMEEVATFPFIKEPRGSKGPGHSEIRENLPDYRRIRLRALRQKTVNEKRIGWTEWLMLPHIPDKNARPKSDKSKRKSKPHKLSEPPSSDNMTGERRQASIFEVSVAA